MIREDAISREWLKTAIHNFYYGLKHTPTEEDIQAYIDAAPSVSYSENPNRCGDLISREETLTAFADYVGSGMSMNDYDALWDIVAKMPSVKTQEPCKDAISRQAACNIIDAIRDCISVEGYWAILERLKKLPSVSMEKTGHWSRKTKVDAYDLCGVKTWGIKCQCDRCTFTTTVVEDFGYYKYCPSCGAKMEEEGE